MGQTYTATNPESGSTTFGELYAIIRNHIDACATLFVGGSSPSSPEEGRPWYDSTNDRLYIYDGSAWRDSDYNTAKYTEITTARGTAASLNARLSVSLNADGSMAGSTPAGSWWSAGTSPWIYYSTVQFKENGDKRSVYTVGRAVYITDGGVYKYSYVTAVAYAATTTTVTLKDAILGASMTTPYYGQETNNLHGRIPWTRLLLANSATSRDSAPDRFIARADGSGGVTVARGYFVEEMKKHGIL